ncbi:hypothetical protein ACF9IK_26260 [Kitasatospora hibisci]|uniref:WXG100-like domain-containing protein n=1 Tax=Kitasatospora hibisci TaxID=3369522 RepID=UPI0037541504
MIELPADLVAVLTTVKSHENGAGIAFPDADEDRLAELARAWDAWNTAAEPRVRAIVASAQQAAAHMSGPAADGFRQYLEKYAGRDDTHAVTVLESGLAMARCLHEASGTVGRTKAAMVQQLRSTKEYLEGGMPGAAPGAVSAAAAQSEGVGLAVDSCRHHVGQASADVESMLRQNAGSVDRMDSAGQACALGPAGGPGAGAGGADAGGPGAGTGGGVGGDARPVLAGLGGPETSRAGSARAEVPDRESGAVCRPGGAAVPGLNLAGFTGAVAGAGAQGGSPSGGAADPAGAGGVSSGVLGPGGAAGAGGVGGRRAGAGGSAGRARAGALPSFAGAGFGFPSGTAAAAAAGSRAGTLGRGPSGTTRQPSGSGAAGTGARAGAGASAAGAGAAGRGPGPGGVHGPGRGGGKKGARGRRRPDLVVGQTPEDEVISDADVHGPAAEVRLGDRQEQRAHRRWLDGARTEAVEPRRAQAPQAAAAGAESPPAPAADLLTQLTSVVLGPDAGSGGRPEERMTGTTGGAPGAGGAESGAGRTEGRSAAPAARPRGGVGLGPAGTVGGAVQAGPDAGGRPAPLREEGGYQVPSPQLRAALAKLAAAGEFDKPAPGGAARQSAARGESPGGGRPGNDE